MKLFAYALALTVGLLSNATAHNVVSGVYGEGLLIEGEIGFSNGEMAQAGVEVNVFDDAGNTLGKTVLADGGVFSFQASSAQKHVFKADLGAGHVATMELDADELSEASSTTVVVLDKKTAVVEAVTEQPMAQAGSAQASTVNVSTDELQSLIRSAVAQQVRPLQKELRAYKEKVMFRDIAGGIGFIFGLFGVAAWMASKRQEKKV